MIQKEHGAGGSSKHPLHRGTGSNQRTHDIPDLTSDAIAGVSMSDGAT